MGLIGTNMMTFLQHDGVSELLEEPLLFFAPLVVLVADYNRNDTDCF